jgi:hypothetical protein
MAGLLWLVWADSGLPLESLPRLGGEKIRTGAVDRARGIVLRSTRDRIDGRGFSTAMVMASCQRTRHALSGASKRQVLSRGSNGKRALTIRDAQHKYAFVESVRRWTMRPARRDGLRPLSCSPRLDSWLGAAPAISASSGRPATSHASCGWLPVLLGDFGTSRRRSAVGQ